MKKLTIILLLIITIDWKCQGIRFFVVMILSQRRFRLQNSLLLTLLVFSSSVLSQAQNNHINNNIIKGTLWTYEQDIPHQTSIVVEAISIDGNISKAAQSDFSGNYQLSDLIVGNYYLRCHGRNGFFYHQVNGQKTVIDVKRDSYVEGIDFVFAKWGYGKKKKYKYKISSIKDIIKII